MCEKCARLKLYQQAYYKNNLEEFKKHNKIYREAEKKRKMKQKENLKRGENGDNGIIKKSMQKIQIKKEKVTLVF